MFGPINVGSILWRFWQPEPEHGAQLRTHLVHERVPLCDVLERHLQQVNEWSASQLQPVI